MAQPRRAVGEPGQQVGKLGERGGPGEERVEAVVAGRGVLLEGLRGLGWDVPDSQANFVWLPTDDAPALAEALWPVAVRPFAGATSEGGGVRVSVGTPEANERLLTAVAALPRP